MLENYLFFGKTGKIAEALGGSAPKPHWFPEARCSATRPPSCYSRHLFQVLKLRPIIS